MKRIVIIFLVILFLWFIANGLFFGINHSITISGFVTNKEASPYRITVNVYRNLNSAEEVEILIKDENMWNSIEINREYKINYFWRNNETPILRYIEINGEY